MLVSLNGRLRLELLAIMPTIFSNKCKAYCIAVHEDYTAQMLEYPPDVVENHRRASEIYRSLVNDFGDSIRVSVVNPMSLRGLMLIVKHKLREGMWIIINGRKIINASTSYDVIRSFIEKELEDATV